LPTVATLRVAEVGQTDIFELRLASQPSLVHSGHMGDSSFRRHR
jgi:hypothetical protein